VVRGLGPALAGAALMAVVILLAERLGPWPRISVAGLLVVGGLGVAAYALPVATLGRDRFRAASGLLTATGEGGVR
jgi:hypothetical protein